MEDRLYLKNKKTNRDQDRFIFIESNEETGGLDYIKLEKLVRIISDLKKLRIRMLYWYPPVQSVLVRSR